ncbi:MAG: DegT/DnrJ/EryC1/StrS family aminotransferase [Acidimicrobiia bacterium]
MRVPFLDLGRVHAPMRDELTDVWWTVLRQSAFIAGTFTERFEEQFATYCERRHCVGVANGTDAIELILAGLGIGPGDEVIVPANTFIATAEAVVNVGAVPVFADVDASRLLIDSEHVSQLITGRTAAVMAVHLYGQPVDMSQLTAVAERAGIVVIEDAAQAHGARWRGGRVGSFGAAAAFSFYPGKNLGALGDGGAVVTDDAELARRVRSLANHGRSQDRHHEHLVVGRNSRLDGLQAGFLSVKLRGLDAGNALRRAVHSSYELELGQREDVVMLGKHEAAEPVHHLEVIRTSRRDQVRAELAAAGIATGVHYPIPCHRQPAFRSHAQVQLPVAERAAREVLSLPMFPSLTPSDIAAVCSEVIAALEVQA